MSSFIKLANNKFKFKWVLLRILPAAFFSGVRVVEATENYCKASVPFKWLTQNPFKSTYFASLSMAAELSTGVLALAHVYKRMPPVSMLVTEVKGSFFKKALGKTIFTCNDGAAIKQAVETAIATNQGQTITCTSQGHNADGELVATFVITWSFKVKG
jgi:hypothetical protein